MRVMTWNIHGARDASLGQIGREIAALTPDVVCLNEVKRVDAVRLGRALGMRAYRAGSPLGPYGVAILTGRSVRSWRRICLDDVRRVERRDAAVVTLADGVEVVAMHLGLRAPQRQRHIEQILSEAGERAIIAGDSNETPDRGVARAMAERFSDAGALAGEPTFPANEPVARIDYIWVPRAAQVERVQVVPTTSSDHRPLVVTLVSATL